MSVINAAEASPTIGRLNAQDTAEWLMSAVQSFRPRDGWLSLGLLSLNLMVVVWSVERADWVPTPSLILVLLLAVLTAVLLSSVPLRGFLVLPIGLAIGVLVVVWQLGNYQHPNMSLQGAEELWDRLGLWLQAVKTSSISIDPVPFAFGLTVAAWLSGYLAGWFFCRHRNFWAVFVLGGIGLFSNLTYLPPNTTLTLGLYLFSGLLVVARVQSVRRRLEWRSRNVTPEEHLVTRSITESILPSAIIVLAALFVLPHGHKIGGTSQVYDFLRSPMAAWENDFNRLFAGLPARRPIGYRIWGDSMAFQGTINPGSTEALRVISPIPMYWKARTYGTYTAKGWVTENTTYKPISWSPSYATPQPPQHDQLEVTYDVMPKYASRGLFAGGFVSAVGRDVRIETYDSPTYVLDFTNPQATQVLPPRLAEAWGNLSQVIQEDAGSVEYSSLSESLPPEFRLLDVERRQGDVEYVTLGELLPTKPDILSIASSDGRVLPDDSYGITSTVSLATVKQLREAGTDYPTWVLVKYTQLPEDLPRRVRDLGALLATRADTPYDRAKAIEEHLADFSYSFEIDPPPYDADGVDYFLFDSQAGYSEYFASSMAVLLRTMGIPARIATGYTPGDKVQGQDLYIVIDSDSHAWVEVYFPDHGWIAFEPTPGDSLPQFSVPDAAFNASLTAGEDLAASPGPTCIDIIDILDDCAEVLGSELPQAQGASQGILGSGPRTWVWMLVALGILLLSLGPIWFGWRRLMSPSEDPKAVFGRLSMLAGLATLAPVAHQTPFQYRDRLTVALPAQSKELSTIFESYVRNLYGRKDLTRIERGELVEAWMRLRIPLFWRILRRSNR